MATEPTEKVLSSLQEALVDLVDLALQGKQAHWNLYGPHFRSIHLQLDEIIDEVRQVGRELGPLVGRGIERATRRAVPAGVVADHLTAGCDHGRPVEQATLVLAGPAARQAVGPDERRPGAHARAGRTGHVGTVATGEVADCAAFRRPVGADMADGKAEVDIARSADEVWAVVGRFEGLDEWMPGVDSCEMDGDVRKLQTMGMEIHEQLKGRDDAARSISYSIVQGPMPIEHHLATITVTPEGDGSRLTWSYEVRPDEMAAAFGPVYEGSAQAVKASLEG